jgi:hypothetical protein
LRSTVRAPLQNQDEDPQGELVDLAWGLGGIQQPAGTLVSQSQPWAGIFRVSAENDTDLPPDDIVDDPNAEDAGGMIVMDWFTSDGYFRGAIVIDVDEDETASFVVYLNALGDPTVTIPLASLGDNSSQTLAVMVDPTRRVEFHCSGSAGLAELRICPSFD